MTVKNSDQSTTEGINLENISRILLRIVAHLPKTEYHQDKSNGSNRRQVEVLQHSNLPDPASDCATSQG